MKIGCVLNEKHATTTGSLSLWSALVYVLTINSCSFIHVAQTSAENQITMIHSELLVFTFCVGYPCSKNSREETKNGLNMIFLVLTITVVNFIMTTNFLACDVILP